MKNKTGTGTGTFTPSNTSLQMAFFQVVSLAMASILVYSCYAQKKNTRADTATDTNTDTDKNPDTGYDTATGIDSDSETSTVGDSVSSSTSDIDSNADTATVLVKDTNTTTHIDTNSDTATDIDSEFNDTIDTGASTDSETQTEAIDTGSDTNNGTDDSDTTEVTFLNINDPGFFDYLRGAFLVIMEEEEDTDWDQVVNKMYLLDFETIIIQAEMYYEDGSETILDYSVLQTILDAASEQYHPMRVLIGLAKPNTPSTFADASDSAFMETLIAKSIASADRIWDQFSEHTSFDGYYLSYEGWTPDENGLGLFGEYVSQVSSHCASKGDGNIATSFSISESLPNPQYIKQFVPDILSSSNVTLAILRDSFENRPQDTFDIATHMTPYFSTFQEALNSTDVVLWGSVDSFDSSNNAPDRNPFFWRISTIQNHCVSAVTNNFSTNWYEIGPEHIETTLLYSQVFAAVAGK